MALFMAAVIVALFGGRENSAVIITIILWMICGIGSSVWFDNIRFYNK